MHICSSTFCFFAIGGPCSFFFYPQQERTVRALYWDEKPAVKPVIRATYFLAKGSGWLPYSEKDAELLEVRRTPDHASIPTP